MISQKFNHFLSFFASIQSRRTTCLHRALSRQLQVISNFIPILLSCFLCLAAGAASYVPSKTVPPKPPREMRAAWIASVANIDWPSTNAITTAQQKAELIAMFERARVLKLNTIIFQVRPGCDALYASSREPWSEYLTGSMGKAPQPFFDPLAFAVEEAHKRGIELHAWFNPFRARHALAKSPAAAGHISRIHPELVKQYGKSLWLDPGLPAVRDYSLGVIMDVVRRYDIDGVHIDDYFYPYKEKDSSGKELDFPDDSSWQKYGAGGKLGRDDWRRENVNVFVHQLYDSIKAAKPWVKFGISPFGIWRPGEPAQVQGLDAYGKLYADSRKWIQNGWADYFAPQLYWSIKAQGQSFPALLDWWCAQNQKHRLVTPGIATGKASGPWTPAEIVEQIRTTRKQTGTAGHIHWSMSELMHDSALVSALQRDVYTGPALVPASPETPAPPLQPNVSAMLAGRSVVVTFRPGATNDPAGWLVQSRFHGSWTWHVLPRTSRTFHFDNSVPEVISVAVLDRYQNTSRPAVVELR